VRIGKLEFIVYGASLPVEWLVVHQVCDYLAHRMHGNQLFVESVITGDVPRLPISAVHGEAIELTNETIGGLSTLWDEFRLGSLSRHSEVLKNTATHHLE
jgi:hypothetical protein